MSTYLERYLNDEYAEVWADLIGLGDEVRQKSVLLDAETVANETMRRARHNLEILLPRLAATGYRFGPDPGEQVGVGQRIPSCAQMGFVGNSAVGTPRQIGFGAR